MRLETDKSDFIYDGAYGSVFRGKVDQFIDVAIKLFETKQLTYDNNQEKPLLRLDHPNVVKLLCVDQLGEYRLHGYELCLGSLKQCFLPKEDPHKYKGPMPSNISVLSQLANGLDYIHSQGIIHGDIHPGSVLIVSRPYHLVKWSGLSPPVERSLQTLQLDDISEHATWMPPEILSWLLELISDGYVEIDRHSIQREGTFEGDVFSTGCLFFYVLTEGMHPFGSSATDVFLNTISSNPKNFKELPSGHIITETLRNMLRITPEERLSINVVADTIISEEIKSKRKLHHFCFHEDEEECVDSLQELMREENNINCVRFENLRCFMECCAYESTADCEYALLEKRLRKRLTTIDQRRNEPGYVAVASYRPKKYLTHYNPLLFLCAYYSEENLIDLLRLLLTCGVNVKSVDETGKNALLLICDNYFGSNLLDIVSLLLDYGLPVNSVDHSGRNPLFYICKHYYRKQTIEVGKLLIARGIQTDFRDGNGWNALLLLCKHFTQDNSARIMQRSPVIEVEEIRMFPLLSTGRYRAQFANTLQLLLRNGCDIYCSDSHGVNAFLLLCQYYPYRDLAEILELFIQRGMDVNYRDESACSALLYLSCRPLENLSDALKLLFRHGAHVNSTDVDGETALMNFCENLELLDSQTSADIVRLLFREGVDVNVTDIFGRNALLALLEFTTYEKAEAIAELLVQNGINVNWKDQDGQSALIMLCKQRFKGSAGHLIDYLIRYGINVKHKDRQGRNSLLHLCQHYEESDFSNIVRALLASGCDVNCFDEDNENAFSKVMKRRNKIPELIFAEVIRLLYQHGAIITSEAFDRDVLLNCAIRTFKTRNITMGILKLI